VEDEDEGLISEVGEECKGLSKSSAESCEVRSFWYVGRDGDCVGESMKYTRRALRGVLSGDASGRAEGEKESRLWDGRAAGAERRRAFLSTRMGSARSIFGGGTRVSQSKAMILMLKPTELIA